MMPSAGTGPDQKHALEALWRKWVFPLRLRPMVHYIAIALPKLCPRLAKPQPPQALCIAPRHHHRPDHPGHLIRKCDCRDLRRAPS
jgi:hypothetical protein